MNNNETELKVRALIFKKWLADKIDTYAYMCTNAPNRVTEKVLDTFEDCLAEFDKLFKDLI